jgi:SAM-dependent methyltransferase
MALLRDRIRPALYDYFGGRMEKHYFELRRNALAPARGRVLEIGGGTGFNLPHYPADIEQLIVTEPAPGMLERARRRAAASDLPVTVQQASAESLPFEDSSFDTVVSTLVLCSVHDVDRAVAEIHRVLRPGGQLLFFEHVRSDDPRRARWQDRLERPWTAVADGVPPEPGHARPDRGRPVRARRRRARRDAEVAANHQAVRRRPRNRALKQNGGGPSKRRGHRVSRPSFALVVMEMLRFLRREHRGQVGNRRVTRP